MQKQRDLAHRWQATSEDSTQSGQTGLSEVNMVNRLACLVAYGWKKCMNEAVMRLLLPVQPARIALKC